MLQPYEPGDLDRLVALSEACFDCCCCVLTYPRNQQSSSMYRGGLKQPVMRGDGLRLGPLGDLSAGRGDKELTVQRPLVLLPIEKDV